MRSSIFASIGAVFSMSAAGGDIFFGMSLKPDLIRV
jgi:hypothetical protein